MGRRPREHEDGVCRPRRVWAQVLLADSEGPSPASTLTSDFRTPDCGRIHSCIRTAWSTGLRSRGRRTRHGPSLSRTEHAGGRRGLCRGPSRDRPCPCAPWAGHRLTGHPAGQRAGRRAPHSRRRGSTLPIPGTMDSTLKALPPSNQRAVRTPNQCHTCSFSTQGPRLLEAPSAVLAAEFQPRQRPADPNPPRGSPTRSEAELITASYSPQDWDSTGLPAIDHPHSQTGSSGTRAREEGPGHPARPVVGRRMEALPYCFGDTRRQEGWAVSRGPGRRLRHRPQGPPLFLVATVRTARGQGS